MERSRIEELGDAARGLMRWLDMNGAPALLMELLKFGKTASSSEPQDARLVSFEWSPSQAYVTGDVPSLEAWIDRVRAVQASPRYQSVVRSVSVQDEVDKWCLNGRKDRVRSRADKALKLSSQDYVWPAIEAMRDLAEIHPVPRTFVAVVSGWTLLMFKADSEEEVVARFADIVPKRTAPTPVKVLEKMALTRILKVLDSIKTHADRYRGSNPGSPRHPLPDPDVFKGTDSLKGWLESPFLNEWWIRRETRELKSVVSREDFTEEVLQSVHRMLQVHEVMSS